MESDESRTNQSANLMVASLAGSLAHVTCKVHHCILSIISISESAVVMF